MPEGTRLLLEHVSPSSGEVAQPKKPLAAVLTFITAYKGQCTATAVRQSVECCMGNLTKHLIVELSS